MEPAPPWEDTSRAFFAGMVFVPEAAAAGRASGSSSNPTSGIEIMASLLSRSTGTSQRSPPQGSAVGPTYPTPQTHGVETTRAEALAAWARGLSLPVAPRLGTPKPLIRASRVHGKRDQVSLAGRHTSAGLP